MDFDAKNNPPSARSDGAPPPGNQAVLAALERLERRLDRIEATIGRATEVAERAPARVATVADTFDSLVARAGDAGIDVEERLRVLAGVAERLTSPIALAAVREVLDRIDVVQRLLESGVLAEAPVAVVERAALSMAATCAEHPAPIGPWGALRAMSDPGVQRAIGFALRFAKRFGETLEPDAAPARLPQQAGAPS